MLNSFFRSSEISFVDYLRFLTEIIMSSMNRSSFLLSFPAWMIFFSLALLHWLRLTLQGLSKVSLLPMTPQLGHILPTRSPQAALLCSQHPPRPGLSIPPNSSCLVLSQSRCSLSSFLPYPAFHLRIPPSLLEPSAGSLLHADLLDTQQLQFLSSSSMPT